MTPRKPSPRHKVTVEIGGEKHVLRSDVPPEYTRAVAAHLDTTLRALPGFPTLEPHRAAILAALAITDELFRAREELRFLREEAERRTLAAAEMLESAVSPGSDESQGDQADDGRADDDEAEDRDEAVGGLASRADSDEGTSLEPSDSDDDGSDGGAGEAGEEPVPALSDADEESAPQP